MRATLALLIAAAAGFAGSAEGSAADRGSGAAHHAASRSTAHHGSSRGGHPARSKRPGHARPTPKPPRRPSTTVGQPPPSAVGTRGEIALRFALAQIGKPYVYGGVGPDSYDCSGLAQRAWQVAGVRIPRTTEQQATFGTPVPPGQARAGDLVIFYADASHVGVYAGDGKVVVAPHQGASVTIQPMKWMPLYAIRRPG
jgi:cell wall-associated NlpC family hydrolase